MNDDQIGGARAGHGRIPCVLEGNEAVAHEKQYGFVDCSRAGSLPIGICASGRASSAPLD